MPACFMFRRSGQVCIHEGQGRVKQKGMRRWCWWCWWWMRWRLVVVLVVLLVMVSWDAVQKAFRVIRVICFH